MTFFTFFLSFPFIYSKLFIRHYIRILWWIYWLQNNTPRRIYGSTLCEETDKTDSTFSFFAISSRMCCEWYKKNCRRLNNLTTFTHRKKKLRKNSFGKVRKKVFPLFDVVSGQKTKCSSKARANSFFQALTLLVTHTSTEKSFWGC